MKICETSNYIVWSVLFPDRTGGILDAVCDKFNLKDICFVICRGGEYYYFKYSRELSNIVKCNSDGGEIEGAIPKDATPNAYVRETFGGHAVSCPGAINIFNGKILKEFERK